ncbi:MAG: redoxin domain-containing protein [Limimaricola sp.]|nr:redoxin domain-containing protein [Limimaricola sp.]
MSRVCAAVVIAVVPVLAAAAGAFDFSFDSIDGGKIDMKDYAGHPVLVANTASLCAFTPQYDDLQAVYDAYKDKGLVVLAIPSDDFQQELANGEAVKEFCTANFNLTLPMTTISHVKGPEALPFYQWLAANRGFVPGWNFNKVLIGADGQVIATWGSLARPTGPAITHAIEAALGGAAGVGG